ncbi:reverse transcriptase domain-containing protein, partial [Tanacetum coccineum]
RGSDNVPLCRKGSNQRSPVNGKRLEADADLFCQRCTTTTGNQLQLNGKTDTGSGIPAEEEIPEPWTFFTDGSSCLEESGAGLILTNPEGMEFTYALRFKFVASNNEAEYEALMAGLRIVEQMGVKNLVAKVDSRLFANQINGLYIAKEQSMIQYLEKAKALVSGFTKFSIEQVSKSENKKADALSKIVSTMEEEGHTWMTSLFEHLTSGTLPAETKKARAIKIKSRQYAIIGGVLYRKSFLELWLRCVGPLQAEYVVQESMKGLAACIPDQGPILEAQGKVKFLIVTIDYFTKWIEAKPVVTITGCQIKKFVWDNIVCKFGLPREIVSNNGKQFRDNPFKDWCDKLNTKQRFAFVKHPQTNGLVERENNSLGEGIKAKLDEGSKNWIKEVPHVLWAHRTMIKTNNRDTPFSLTYDTEAVIPVEIGMPSLRFTKVNKTQNDKALLLNLNMLEEKRERAAIQEAKSKARMEKYYNAKVRSTTFRPRDFVYRNNEAIHAKEGGKLGPKWEGPYEVVEALGKGAYKIRNGSGDILSRT